MLCVARVCTFMNAQIRRGSPRSSAFFFQKISNAWYFLWLLSHMSHWKFAVTVSLGTQFFVDFFIKGNHRCVEKHSFEVWNIDRLEKNIYLYICTKIELINFKIVQPTNCTIAQMHWRGPHISLLCVCLHLTYVNANTNTHIC